MQYTLFHRILRTCIITSCLHLSFAGLLAGLSREECFVAVKFANKMLSFGHKIHNQKIEFCHEDPRFDYCAIRELNEINLPLGVYKVIGSMIANANEEVTKVKKFAYRLLTTIQEKQSISWILTEVVSFLKTQGCLKPNGIVDNVLLQLDSTNFCGVDRYFFKCDEKISVQGRKLICEKSKAPIPGRFLMLKDEENRGLIEENRSVIEECYDFLKSLNVVLSAIKHDIFNEELKSIQVALDISSTTEKQLEHIGSGNTNKKELWEGFLTSLNLMFEAIPYEILESPWKITLSRTTFFHNFIYQIQRKIQRKIDAISNSSLGDTRHASQVGKATIGNTQQVGVNVGSNCSTIAHVEGHAQLDKTLGAHDNGANSVGLDANHDEQLSVPMLPMQQQLLPSPSALPLPQAHGEPFMAQFPQTAVSTTQSPALALPPAPASSASITQQSSAKALPEQPLLLSPSSSTLIADVATECAFLDNFLQQGSNRQILENFIKRFKKLVPQSPVDSNSEILIPNPCLITWKDESFKFADNLSFRKTIQAIEANDGGNSESDSKKVQVMLSFHLMPEMTSFLEVLATYKLDPMVSKVPLACFVGSSDMCASPACKSMWLSYALYKKFVSLLENKKSCNAAAEQAL